MKSIHISIIILLLASSLISVCHCIEEIIHPDAISDQDFKNLLIVKMMEYNDWLNSTGQDPSIPIRNSVFLQSSGRLNLTCDISNQVIIGHSTKFMGVGALSNFAGHYFQVTRIIDRLYSFNGDLTCSGVILASGFPDVYKDIPFVGSGHWVLATNDSTEVMQVNNVGITSQGKFNLVHSWINYKFEPTFDYFLFNGKFTNTENGQNIRNYDKIVDAFRSLYNVYLRRDDYQVFNDFNPSKKLLMSYLIDHVIKNTVLDDPPLPYIPTPSTSTTTTSTTTEATTTMTGTTSKSTSTTSRTTSSTLQYQLSGSTHITGSSIIMIIGLISLTVITAF